MNQEHPDVQAGLEKIEEPQINCQHLLDPGENKIIPGGKKITSASLTPLKPLTVWIITNWGKFQR